MKKNIIYIMLLAMLTPIFMACDDEKSLPPIVVPEGGLGTGIWNDPFTATQVLDGSSGSAVWMKGYIVGWIDVDKTDNAFNEISATFTTPATVPLNLLIASNPDETDWTKCIPVQLPSGAVRTALNLKDNPDNLGKLVCLKGNCERYFGKNGFKGVSEWNFGETGIEEEVPDTPDEPTIPSGKQTYKKVADVKAGGSYLLVADKICALNLAADKNYGWLYTAPVTVNGETIELDNAQAVFTFETAEGGYYIKSPEGRFYFMDGTYNSFNIAASAGDGSIWTVTPQADGTVAITNVAKNKTVQYSSQFTSFGAYPDKQGVMPTLYELQK